MPLKDFPADPQGPKSATILRGPAWRGDVHPDSMLDRKRFVPVEDLIAQRNAQEDRQRVAAENAEEREDLFRTI